MAAGSIVVDLLMKTGSFETDTARAQRSLKKLKAEADDLGRTIGLAFTATAVGLGYLVSRTLDADDRLQKLAQSSGIAADTLGGIGHAADLAGVDLETAARGVTKLNKSIAEAASGNELALQAFDAIGVSVKDAAGHTKEADKVLAELADKFAGYADGPEKAALALRVFGKAGAELIPLLNGGGAALAEQIEYWKRYSGFTEEAAQQSEVFNDTVTRIKLQMGAFGRALTAEVLPAIQNLADLFLDARERGDGFKDTAHKIAEGFKAIVVAGAYVATTFVTFGDQIGAFFARAKALATFDFAGADAIKKEAAANLDATRKSFTAFYDAIYNGKTKAANAPDPITGQRAAPRLPPTASAGRGAARSARAFTGASYEEQITQKAASLLEDSDVTRAKVYADTLARLDSLYFDAGISAELYGSAVQKLVGSSDTSEAATRALADQMAEAKRIYEDTRTPIEELGATQAHLNDLLAAGAISWDTYSRAVFKAQDAYDAAIDKTKEVASELDAFTKKAAENVQDLLGQGLYDAMQGNFKSIGDAFAKMIQRMAAEAAAADLTRSLFGGNAKGGTGPGLIGQAFNALGGSSSGGGLFGALEKLFGGFFAGGGDPPLDKISVVGERGPEFFVPKTAGTIVPMAKAGGAAGRTQNISINVAPPQGMSRDAASQVGAAIARQLAIADRRNN